MFDISTIANAALFHRAWRNIVNFGEVGGPTTSATTRGDWERFAIRSSREAPQYASSIPREMCRDTMLQAGSGLRGFADRSGSLRIPVHIELVISCGRIGGPAPRPGESMAVVGSPLIC